MNIITIKEKNKIVKEDMLCDICGKSCKSESAFLGFEYLKLSATWYSNRDHERGYAQVCVKCVREKLSFIKFVEILNKVKI